ncbi:MAG: glucosyltransferase domain-containing protein [Holosporaceae bacterium]|jgi:hypothetical protein|nr:glucosyltransferase domain-containing protein [Holosporaceae bacterium]
MSVELLDTKDKKYFYQSFGFFFFVAICGYLSIMMSFSPYRDDYCRYISNYPVEVWGYSRVATRILEILSFFSLYSYDAAPFSTVLSCAVLASVAVICKEILNIAHQGEYASHKYTFACLIPIVVNPYLAEILIFRFDNLFMTIALLCSTGAAYFSIARSYRSGAEKLATEPMANLNTAQWIFIQLGLLLLSLLFYQPAFSAYIVVFTYVLLVNLSKDKPLLQIVSETRHWIYSILFSLTAFFPFTINEEGKKLKCSVSKIMPHGVGDLIDNVIGNICNYSKGLYNDWSANAAGMIFFALFACFILTFLADTWRNIKNKQIAIVRIVVISVFAVAFLLSPLGVNIPLELYYHKIHGFIMPRVIYTMGFLMAFVLYKNYFFIMRLASRPAIAVRSVQSKKHMLYRRTYEVFLFFFGVWSLGYMNCFGNIMYVQQLLQHNVFYDLANDFYEIKQNNPKLSELYLTGNVRTPVMRNFYNLYPINNRILPESWQIAVYSMFGFYCKEYGTSSLKKSEIEDNIWDKSKVLLKSKPWYDVYSVDDRALYVKLNGIDTQYPHIPPRRIVLSINDR